MTRERKPPVIVGHHPIGEELVQKEAHPLLIRRKPARQRLRGDRPVLHEKIDESGIEGGTQGAGRQEIPQKLVHTQEVEFPLPGERFCFRYAHSPARSIRTGMPAPAFRSDRTRSRTRASENAISRSFQCAVGLLPSGSRTRRRTTDDQAGPVHSTKEHSGCGSPASSGRR